MLNKTIVQKVQWTNGVVLVSDINEIRGKLIEISALPPIPVSDNQLRFFGQPLQASFDLCNKEHIQHITDSLMAHLMKHGKSIFSSFLLIVRDFHPKPVRESC